MAPTVYVALWQEAVRRLREVWSWEERGGPINRRWNRWGWRVLVLGLLVGGLGADAQCARAASVRVGHVERRDDGADVKAGGRQYFEREPGKVENPVQADTTTPPGTGQGVTVQGLVLDETHSVVGRTFYDAFYDRWKAPDESSGFTITIQEQPLPQFGSRLTVRVEGTIILRSQFRPGSRKLETAAQRAVRRARYYLQTYYEPRRVY